jgi:hypothetical protein
VQLVTDMYSYINPRLIDPDDGDRSSLPNVGL